MKTISKFLKLLFAMLLFIQTTEAQQISNNNENSLMKNCGSCGLTSRLSMNGGFTLGKTYNKNNINTLGFGLDYFHALKTSQIFDRWGKNISCGINAGGSFFNGSVVPFGGSLPDPFKVDEQTFNAVTGSNNSKSSRYFVGLGPQLNLAFADRFVFSPIFQVGYLGLSQDEFIATQTVTTQAVSPPYTITTKTYDLLIQTESRTNGLGFIPKARISYMITNKIGFWAEASYLIGPKVINSISTFTPEPLADSSGAYTLQQMNYGTYSTEIKENRFNSLSFNFGVVFSFDTPHHIPKKDPRPVIPQETNSKDDSDSQVCANLNVDFIKEDNSDSLIYSLVITNNYTGTNLNNKPKSFNIIIKENAVTKIDEPLSAGLSRTPISIPPDTKEVSWNSSLFIPNGETKLGKLCFANDASKKFTVVYEWLNKNQKTICKDSISFNDSKYYYEMNKENNNYTEVYDKLLNVQFSNEYASSENLKIKIYDVKTKKLVSPRSDKSLSVNSLNGLNRITIDLKDYQLNPGALYLLIVSDSNINYNFNFKITDKIINDREK